MHPIQIEVFITIATYSQRRLLRFFRDSRERLQKLLKSQRGQLVRFRILRKAADIENHRNLVF